VGVSIKENFKLIKQMYAAFKFIRETEVYVGITEETDVARENGMTNSSLLYLHENGVPSHNIPPRPVLQPALAQKDVKKKMHQVMRKGMAEAFIHGDLESCEIAYEKAGMIGRDAVKKYITEGTNLAPNAPETIRRKGSSTPLIDTSSMLNSITYAVRKKR